MPTRDTAWTQGTPCWVDVQVDDLNAARDFYSALFGWQIDDGPAEAGGYLMALKDGRPAAGIGPKPEGMQMPSVWSTYLAVDDVDAVAAKATEAGAQLFMPPFDVMDVGRMTFLADPTGAPVGLWQAGRHNGAGVFNEHGAYCWNELHTRNLPRAQEFYTALFGYEYTPFGDGYVTFANPGGNGMESSIGGMADDDVMGVPAEVPAHWLTWFQVDDTDAALEKVKELGGQVVMGPDDSPIGRMGVVAGLQGEMFGLITPQDPGTSANAAEAAPA